MPGSEHVMFADEVTWGQYVAPTKAIPVTTSAINPTQALLVNADTGGGRGRRVGTPGAKTVEGPITTGLYGISLGYLLRTMYAGRLKTTAGTGFRNKLMVDDDADQASLSIQKRYRDSVAESIRGAKLNGYTINARSKEYATVETRWLAKDAAASGSGGGWADKAAPVTLGASTVASPTHITTLSPHGLSTGDRVTIAGHTGSTPAVDGTYTVTVIDSTHFTVPVNVSVGGTGGTVTEIAPAVIDPVPYDVDEPEKLRFDEGVLILGGSKALTSGEIVLTGGVERCEFDNIQLVLDNGLSNDAFGVCLGDPTVQDIIEGTRAISLRFEPNFAAVDEEFYNKWGNGTELSALLKFVSKAEYDTGFHYEFWWALPLVKISNAPNPELNATRGLKRQTVEAMAFSDQSLAGAPDHSLVIQSSEDLTI